MFKIPFSSPLFQGINREFLKDFLDSRAYQTKKYGQNDMIILAGEPINHLMIILEGSVRGEMIDAAGRVFRMEDLSAPMLIAPGFIFGKKNAMPVNAIANENCEIGFIPKPAFIELIQKEETVLLNFLALLSNKTQFLSHKIKEIFLQSIKGKIANYIISLSEKYQSDTVTMEHSKTWLAEKFNVARPSVSRVFSEMNQQGVIQINGKNIQILNKEKLIECINAV